jgi:hypothetical protein
MKSGLFFYPEEERKLTLYQRAVRLFCWIKLIPVSRDARTGDYQFHLLSLPTLFSSLWSLVPLAYYLYYYLCLGMNLCDSSVSAADKLDNLTANLSLATANNTTMIGNKIDQYLAVASLVSTFIFTLLLPPVLGHFAALNPCVMLGGRWPIKGWMLLTASFVSLGTRTCFIAIGIFYVISLGNFDVQREIPSALMILTAVVLLLIVSILIGSTQTMFVKEAQNIRDAISPLNVRQLLQDYTNIREGVGPFYLLSFAIHAPMVLCFAFWSLAYISYGVPILQILSNVIWSWFSLVHICLMSEDCFNAMQELLPSIRYILYLSFPILLTILYRIYSQ